MTRQRNKPDAVGYKHPPQEHRFRPGCSGNPSGRKRGVRNLRSDLADELSEVIAVSEGAVALKLTKQRALVKRLCAKALNGDMRAMNQLVSLVLRLFPAAQESEPDEALSEGDEAIIARFFARSKAKSVRKRSA